MRLQHIPSNSHFFLTNVYGPPTWEGKAEFCDELRELKGECNDLWVVCGDFNLTQNLAERSGHSWSGRVMSLFNDLVNELELLDLPLSNQRFTWSNLQSHPSLAKLDRFLVSTEWDQTFPLSKVKVLPRITPDHSPIVLSSKDFTPRHLFRFEEVWLGRDDFCSLLPIWWNEVPRKNTSVLSLVAKLRHCRLRIREWSSANFNNIVKTKKNLADEIQKLDQLEEQQPLSNLQAESRKCLKAQLAKVTLDEEILWKARAGQQWLREGDGNTKFFHACANSRRPANAISMVSDGGNHIFSEEAKKEYFYKYFHELFAPVSSDPASIGDWSNIFGGKPFLNPDQLTAHSRWRKLREPRFNSGLTKLRVRAGLTYGSFRNSGT